MSHAKGRGRHVRRMPTWKRYALYGATGLTALGAMGSTHDASADKGFPVKVEARTTPKPSAPIRGKYVTTNGSEPFRLVFRHCGTAEDAWAHLKLVDFSGDTTTYRCEGKGY